MKPLLKITTIGAGYVGLVTGVCFSDFGYDVTCVDKDAEKINRLNAGEIPIFEKGLEALVKRNKRANRLHFTADLAVAMQDTDVVFIGVGTPPAEDGSADLQYVMAAARELAPLLSGFTVIAIKSTVPVGTGGQVEALIANAFLATKISFINEIADLCEAVGANITDLAFGMGLDERIGSKYLAPGPGYGGSCFPKDTVALLDIAKKAGAQARIVEQVIEVNDTRKASMAQKVTDLCGGSVDGLTVAILGLAFKPDTDDIRETASFPIIQVLQKAGANIRAFDPAAMEESAAYLEDVTFCEDAYDCASGADVLILATEWTDFQALDFSRLKTLMAAYRFADLRNVYTPEDVRKLGFDYVSIGRP